MRVVCNSCYEFEADSTALNVFCFMYPSHAFFQSRGQASRAEGSLYKTQVVQHNLGQITPTDSHVISKLYLDIKMNVGLKGITFYRILMKP